MGTVLNLLVIFVSIILVLIILMQVRETGTGLVRQFSGQLSHPARAGKDPFPVHYRHVSPVHYIVNPKRKVHLGPHYYIMNQPVIPAKAGIHPVPTPGFRPTPE